MKPIKKSTSRTRVCEILVVAVAFLIITACMLVISSAIRYKKIYSIRKNYSVDESLARPSFSREGGIYKESFYLRLSSVIKNADIRYTTDGSLPTDTSALYTVPLYINNKPDDLGISEIPTSTSWRNPRLPVSRGIVVKAALFLKSGHKSAEAFETYLVRPNPKGGYTLPVVSIATHQDYLFNRDSGIYVLGKTFYDKKSYVKKDFKMSDEAWKAPANFNKRGSEEAIPISVEIFNTSGRKIFNSAANARIKGNYSRDHPQKSLLLEMTGHHKNQKICLSDSSVILNTNSLLLRNSGNDWYHAEMRDAVMHSLINNTIHVEKVNFSPVILFINGEYWGIIFLTENIDIGLLSARHGIPEDSISLLKMDIRFNKERLLADPCMQHLLDFADKNNLEADSNFNYVMNYFLIEDYTDYIIYEILISNIDWPDNNILMWRYKTDVPKTDTAFHVRDGRWRMIPYDLDYSFGGDGKFEYYFNMLGFVWNDPYRFNHLFQQFMKNRRYKSYFIERFKYHLQKTFLPERIDTFIENYYNLLKPEIDEHIARWRYPETRAKWENEVKMLRKFPSQRIPVQIKEFENFFNTKLE